MKNISSSFGAVLAGVRDGSLVPVQFVWFRARDRATGAPAELGLWTWDDDISVQVLSGTTGLPVTRSYYGALNLEISDIHHVSDLTIQSVTIGMSQIADAAQQLVRGYDLRLAKCEIHEMAFNPETGTFASAPELVMLGEVDGAPLDTPAIGQDGGLEVTVVSDAISMLRRTNPQKSSYEGQRRRGGDEWGKYSSTVATWDIPWGKK